ncbi:MAG TPA: molybdate ABC transporter substrate-binding protein [Streptosporangiaceae bacterium]
MTRQRFIAGAFASVAAIGLLAAGCGSTGNDNGSGSGNKGSTTTLTVFAAASLTGAFGTIGKQFEAAHPGTKVRFSFGGSDTLAQQINNGAPADVFAAASPKTMKMVTDAKNAAGTPTTFVKNRLEIAVPRSNPAKITGLKDLANKKNKVVLCAASVPCGAAAQKALKAANLKVTPVSEEKDVKAALTKVGLDEADAALVYRTDVKSAPGKVKGIDFPEAAKAINDYPMVTVAKAPQPKLAKQFESLVLSAAGMKVLTTAGFDKP